VREEYACCSGSTRDTGLSLPPYSGVVLSLLEALGQIVLFAQCDSADALSRR